MKMSFIRVKRFVYFRNPTRRKETTDETQKQWNRRFSSQQEVFHLNCESNDYEYRSCNCHFCPERSLFDIHCQKCDKNR
ncbi:hypothetical protein NY2A_B296L [Paramecium bursaria Chlorella virus NY2A]|uniref:Uncharacterized protein B296L n=1 Tax=Paramecium bursaria Chlorella virus NY2A TaxID=46021 RepID=A7IWH1_PBCVN|nr:hypothetical protein NY2A_B296L [Paramecium bursaria Chlorella virus NY2A]ABT14695.1 hypothetical protein NY2A_B296L [Paramecium bursaria Chlorella virus NY2A]